MPEAHAAAGGARVPREIFEHAHDPILTVYPTSVGMYAHAYIIFKIPDNWNGTASLELIIIPSVTNANWTVSINIDGGTDGEAPNTHTQLVSPFAFATTANVVAYIDITAAFAAILAVLTGGDTVLIDLQDIPHEAFLVYGAFWKET